MLRGLREEFCVTAEVIRATDKSITESISLLVVQEATVEERETKIENNDSAFMINEKERRCYYCDKKEHFKHECYDNPQSIKLRGIQFRKNSNISYQRNNNF